MGGSRITLRSATHPASTPGEDATGTAATNTSRRRQLFLEQALHHVGGVGANHHQLALRHVIERPSGRRSPAPAPPAMLLENAAEHRAQPVAPDQRCPRPLASAALSATFTSASVPAAASRSYGLGDGVLAACKLGRGVQAPALSLLPSRMARIISACLCGTVSAA
jgi:hypothetical protein